MRYDVVRADAFGHWSTAASAESYREAVLIATKRFMRFRIMDGDYIAGEAVLRRGKHNFQWIRGGWSWRE